MHYTHLKNIRSKDWRHIIILNETIFKNIKNKTLFCNIIIKKSSSTKTKEHKFLRLFLVQKSYPSLVGAAKLVDVLTNIVPLFQQNTANF